MGQPPQPPNAQQQLHAEQARQMQQQISTRPPAGHGARAEVQGYPPPREEMGNVAMPTDHHTSSSQKLNESGHEGHAEQKALQNNYESQSRNFTSMNQSNNQSIFQQYFKKFQEEEKEQDLVERMSIQPTNQEESIQVGDEAFRFKKFNSQKYDPKQINLKTLEYQLNSLVEEITQDDKETTGLARQA